MFHLSSRLRWTRLPSRAAITAAVLTERRAGVRPVVAYEEAFDAEETHCEVRLHRLMLHGMACAGGSDLRFGDAQIDRLHGDAIGCASFDCAQRPTRAAALDVARRVLADARDQMAKRVLVDG